MQEILTGGRPRQSSPAARRAMEAAWERQHPQGRVDYPAPGSVARYILWNFAVDGAALKEAHRAALQDIVRSLQALRRMRPSTRPTLLIDGHASSSGNALVNGDLASRRAEAVAAYLRQQQIQAHVVTKAFGAEQPRVPNDTPERMAMNRRVEVMGTFPD